MKSSGDGVGDGEREEIQSPRLESTDLIGPSGHKITRDDVMAAIIDAAARALVVDMLGFLSPSANDECQADCRGAAEVAIAAAAPIIRADERAKIRAELLAIAAEYDPYEIGDGAHRVQNLLARVADRIAPAPAEEAP